MEAQVQESSILQVKLRGTHLSSSTQRTIVLSNAYLRVFSWSRVTALSYLWVRLHKLWAHARQPELTHTHSQVFQQPHFSCRAIQAKWLRYCLVTFLLAKNVSDVHFYSALKFWLLSDVDFSYFFFKVNPKFTWKLIFHITFLSFTKL